MARAVWFKGVREAELREEEVAPPVGDEIQVEARYSLVSAGTEMNFYRGEVELPDLFLPTAAGQLPFPVKFAYQTVGVVVDTPPGSAWSVGDPVFCTHPHQDLFNIVPENGIVSRLPPDTNLRRAVFGTMFTSALQGLLDARPRPGDCIAVSGLGLIGSFVAFLARMNAAKLVVIDPIEERRSRAKWLGADAIVAPDDAAASIAELTGGRGVDLFVEASGAPAAFQMALQVTGDGGTIDIVSWYGTRSVELVLSPEFHLRRFRILSSHIGALAIGGYPGWDPERGLQTSVSYLSTIDERNLITHEIPFGEAPRAYELIDREPAAALGVLLVHDSV